MIVVEDAAGSVPAALTAMEEVHLFMRVRVRVRVRLRLRLRLRVRLRIRGLTLMKR